MMMMLAPSFPGSPRTVKGAVGRLVEATQFKVSLCKHTAEHRSACTLQSFDFVVYIYCSALKSIICTAVTHCASTLQSWLSVIALGKVQSGLQSITRRKTNKMSFTHEKNEQEIQKETKPKFFCILEEK